MSIYSEKVLAGESLNYDELKFVYNMEIKQLMMESDQIRDKFCEDKGELCTIMNVKSGHCSEDCKFCAQSAHYNANIESYDLKGVDEIVKKALELETKGIKRFSIVSSGRGVQESEISNIVEILNELKEKTSLKICASLGILDKKSLNILKNAGLDRYHHNLETSERYYDDICTTHSYEERINCIKNAQSVGIEVCSGIIVGLGESLEDIIDVAILLRDLKIGSIPINLLNPIANTPLENQGILDAQTYFRAVGVMRFVNPNAWIRYAGGRVLLGDMQESGLRGGINSSITGTLLTTKGCQIEKDIKMFTEMGFKL